MTVSTTLNDFMGQGFGFTFIRGKIPFEKEWQNHPHSEEDAEKRHKQGRNLGVHAGEHSNNIIWIDLDERFTEFLETFPSLCNTLHIVRDNAPDRGKVAIRITDTLPASTNYKPIASEPPVAELLSTGRQAAVIGRHPSGEFYQTNGLPVTQMTFDEVDQIWHGWTDTHLSRIGEPPKQPQTTPKLIQVDTRKSETPDDESLNLVQRLRNHYTAYDIFDHFGMVGDVVNANAGFIRLLNNGGLLVGDPADPEHSWKWFSHSACIGGDIFDAWYFCKTGEKIPRLNPYAFTATLYEMARTAGIELPKEPPKFTDTNSQISHTLVEWIQVAKVAIAEHHFKGDGKLRAALGVLQILEHGQDIEYHISSRHLADLTGMSHRSAQKAIRWLCPELLESYERKREEDAQAARELLTKAANCTDGEVALSLLSEEDKNRVIDRMQKAETKDLYANVILYISDRVHRLEAELDQIDRGRARGELLNLLVKVESFNGAFANVFKLNLEHLAPISAQKFPQNEQRTPLGALWKPLRGLDFIALYMRDDAFIRNIIPQELKHSLSDQEPEEGWTPKTLMNAIVASNGEQYLKSIGQAGVYVIFELSLASHTISSLAQEIGMHEGSLRRVIKRMCTGMEPMIEKHKIGRRTFLSLSDEWEESLSVARRHMFTDGVIHRRTVRHTMERLERIRMFLPLITDEEVQIEYSRIKTNAQKLLDAIEGKRQIKPLDVSNLLADIENDLAFVDVQIKTEGDFYAYLQTLESEDAKQLRHLLAGDYLPHITECKILANRLGLAHVLYLVMDVNEVDELVRQFRRGEL